jgi:hypothetical protein
MRDTTGRTVTTVDFTDVPHRPGKGGRPHGSTDRWMADVMHLARYAKDHYVATYGRGHYNRIAAEDAILEMERRRGKPYEWDHEERKTMLQRIVKNLTQRR